MTNTKSGVYEEDLSLLMCSHFIQMVEEGNELIRIGKVQGAAEVFTEVECIMRALLQAHKLDLKKT